MCPIDPSPSLMQFDKYKISSLAAQMHLWEQTIIQVVKYGDDIFFMTVLETDKALIIYTSKPVLIIFVNIVIHFATIYSKCRLFVSFIKF